MSEREPRFRYRLESLERLRRAQGESARVAAARAAADVEVRAKECTAAAQRIEGAQQGMREAARRGATLQPDELLRLRAYLGRLCDEHARLRRVLDDARRTQVRLLEELEVLRRDARALERHRARLQRESDGRTARAAADRADERWLCARRGG